MLSNLKAHFANWRQWELNPVVVKELRQAVRSWAVTGTLLLFLVVLFCSAVIFFVTQSLDVSTNQRLGADIFSIFSVILTGASLIFIPLYIGVRVAAERTESNLDLLYISTLTPGRIIRGKFFCGVYVAVLFFSACMPFMTFTNMLRGVDLPSVFFILLCLFFAVCCAVQVAIFLACLPISKLLKILIGLFAAIASFWAVAGLTFWTFQMMSRGVGSMMSDRGFWAGFLTVCSIVFSSTLLLHFLSVALISPLSANRALPVRIYMTVVWMLGAVLCFAWANTQHDVRLMMPWAVVSFVVLSLSLAVVVSNQDVLSRRVQRTIPEAGLKRAVAFLFYNGAAGGLVWLALLMGLTYVATYLTLTLGLFSSRLGTDEIEVFMVSSAAAVLYAFDYALTGLFLHRQFLGRRSPRLAGIMAILLPGAWALAPVIFFFFLDRLSMHVIERSQPGNIFNIFSVTEDAQKVMHLECATAWLVLMLALNAKWFGRQVKNFRPWRRVAPSETAGEVPPIIPAAAN